MRTHEVDRGDVAQNVWIEGAATSNGYGSGTGFDDFCEARHHLTGAGRDSESVGAEATLGSVRIGPCSWRSHALRVVSSLRMSGGSFEVPV
jgi:hypothetical protein